MRRIKGTIVTHSGEEVTAYVEIVTLDATPSSCRMGVHRYYFRDSKKIFAPIDGQITKRYTFHWKMDSSETFIDQGYKFLLSLPEFSNYVIEITT